MSDDGSNDGVEISSLLRFIVPIVVFACAGIYVCGVIRNRNRTQGNALAGFVRPNTNTMGHAAAQQQQQMAYYGQHQQQQFAQQPMGVNYQQQQQQQFQSSFGQQQPMGANYQQQQQMVIPMAEPVNE